MTFRGFLRSEYFPRDPRNTAAQAQDWVTVDRLLNLLIKQDRIYGGPGQVPTYDWPNPRIDKDPRFTARRSQVEGQSLNINLLVKQDRILGAIGQVITYDWTNPRIDGAPRFTAQRSQIEGQVLNVNLLVGQDRILDGIGRVITYDWQNPTRGIDRRQDWTQSLVLSAIAPLNQSDWPNPTRGIDRRQDWAQSRVLTAVTPFNQEDWPNPTRRLGTVDSYGWGNNLQLTTLAVSTQAPFNQTDWPNPTRAIDRRQDWSQRTSLTGQDQIYAGPGQVPAYDWPNPTLLRRDPRQDWSQSLVLAAVVPFVQTDWPNPIRGIDRRQDWSQAVSPVGQDQIYAGPGQVPGYDWRNPAGPAFPAENRTWIQQGNALSFVPPGTPVVMLFDWPNPMGPSFPIDNRNFYWQGNAIIGGGTPTPPPPPPVVGGIGKKKKDLRQWFTLPNGMRILATPENYARFARKYPKIEETPVEPAVPAEVQDSVSVLAAIPAEAQPEPVAEEKYDGPLLGIIPKSEIEIPQLKVDTRASLAAAERLKALQLAREIEEEDEAILLEIILMLETIH